MKKISKSILLFCLLLCGGVSCNTQQPAPTKKSTMPARQGAPSCPKDDPCDTDPCK